MKNESNLYDEEIDLFYVRKRDCKCVVNYLETDDFVWCEVERLVYRLINVENVLLVANDPAYMQTFEKMEEQEVEIMWTRCPHSWRDSREECIYPWTWIDASYPIAYAMGITRTEL